MKRILISGAVAAAFALSAFAQPITPAPQQATHHEMPRPKNLQVLPKDISSAGLMKLMHGYTQDLGVHCSFCHAQDPQTHHIDFASDANPRKTTARTMISMTDSINTKYLSQVKDPDGPMKVGCATCHRGHSMPPAFTPPPEKQHGQ